MPHRAAPFGAQAGPQLPPAEKNVLFFPRPAPCRFDPATGLLHATPNMNLVNLALRLGGPCTEAALCTRILAFQALCCAAAFAARKMLAGIYK